MNWSKVKRAVAIFLQDPWLYLLYPIALLLGYYDDPRVTEHDDDVWLEEAYTDW